MRDEREYVIENIGVFLNRSGSEWDWGNFISQPLQSESLDSIRRRAATVRLPLDAKGEIFLKELLNEAEYLSESDLTKPRPWRVETGLVAGLLAGALLWWLNFVPGGGLFQNPELILAPTAAGGLVVALRNRRKMAGIYDPDLIAHNKRGRI